jgi:hypothetical protein
MLNPYADAGRTAKLWRINASVTAEKDGDTCYEVVESMAYSWNKKISHATGSNKLSHYKSIHQYDIIPFFEAIIFKHKKALPIKASHISYRCQHALIKRLTHNSTFTIQLLTFGRGQDKWLNYLKKQIGNKPVQVNIVSEEPVSCFSYWHANTLVVVCYNLFDKKEEIKPLADAYIEQIAKS